VTARFGRNNNSFLLLNKQAALIRTISHLTFAPLYSTQSYYKMSAFSGYEKMPTSLKKLGLSESDFSELEKLKWAVTEKVRGANFSFVYKNGTLRFAKRKAYLSWTDDFFGFQLVVNKIESNITPLF
jgi:hypothetical protein